MSKATIISVYPKEINEYKPGIFPGQFKIPACSGSPTALIIGPSYHWEQFIEAERKPIRIETSAIKVASAIVNDFIYNVPGYSFERKAYPGLAAVEGAIVPDLIEATLGDLIKDLRSAQNRWFGELVAEADDVWSRSRQHRFINSLQRTACSALGYTREWLVELPSVTGPKFCPACMSKVHPEAVICGSCSFILNEERYSKMKFAKEKKG